MAALRAAVIGVGYLGRFHAQKYHSLMLAKPAEIQLAGVFDLNLESCAKVAAELKVKAFSSMQELLGAVDLVTVATNTPHHFEIARQLLNSGKHVNVEKPICLRLEEAEELVALAQQRNLKLAVGHSERFSPVFRHFTRTMKHPRFVEFQRMAPFNLRGADVSVIHDLMIHDLDLLLSIDSTQPRVVNVSAGQVMTNSYDWATASIEFASGLRSVISATRLATNMTRTIRAYDSSHQYHGNFQTSDVDHSFKSEDGSFKTQSENLGKADNLLAETENFVAAVQGQLPCLVSGKDGARALGLAEQVVALLDTQKSW